MFFSGSSGSSFGNIILICVFLFLAYILYSACTARPTTIPPVGRSPGGGPGYGYDGYGGGGPGGRPSPGCYPDTSTYYGGATGGGPGFFSGLGAGGLLGYLFGRRPYGAAPGYYNSPGYAPGYSPGYSPGYRYGSPRFVSCLFFFDYADVSVIIMYCLNIYFFSGFPGAGSFGSGPSFSTPSRSAAGYGGTSRR